MSHYDKLAEIARNMGLEPIAASDNASQFAAKLVAILASHVEQTNAALAQLTQRKPGRPRKE